MKIKLLTSTSKVPSRQTCDAAGYDLYADIQESLTINPRETAKVSSGISVEIPSGFFGGIYARSGLATKRGLRPSNCVGVIDSDYRGPVIVALHNDSDKVQTIEPQERIAQLIIQPYASVTLEIVDELTSTERGEKGFGSTGTK